LNITDLIGDLGNFGWILILFMKLLSVLVEILEGGDPVLPGV
jgi:hypothetical protein